MGPVSRFLKHETADLHREAERHVRILDDDATEATYARYLMRMLGFHAPMEDRFAAHQGLAEVGFDVWVRRKQGLIRDDLAALGLAGVPAPRCADLPDVGNLARALGAAYVLEGSTLGGPFIIARMRVRLGHLVGVATAFLEGYRSATGPMWRSFSALVERCLAAPAARDAAVDTARSTFAKLIAWLDEVPAEPPQPFRWLAPRAIPRPGAP
jgi:heme oxygenase